ncbi:MAG: adenylate/guanylate cyclase domain-containing protein [Kangiellaceae bacterium]|jgi:hypothetical protein|nr:adenylate/guanylate cyclase domain-containing protein [Kangiellaceae bacterium]
MLFSKGKKQTIMFADVAGSSTLYKVLGNEKAKSIIDDMIKIMVFNTGKYQGRVIKTIGDEVMACFDNSEQACLAALGIQTDSEALSRQHTTGVRIGIGHGKIIEEGEDVFGEAVNDAAFVTGIAKSAQILLTESCIGQLSENSRNSIQEFDEVAIKGTNKHSKIYRYFWKTPSSGFSETQVFTVDSVSQHLDKSVLQLNYRDTDVTITPDMTPFVIGRHKEQCSLSIDSELVSRDHCHILFSRGKFVLVDHSTNGTYILPESAQEIYLRREELPLLGSGSINLGVSHSNNQHHIIKFEA